jgi:predicted phage terminase large subunit-like protein
MRIVQSWDTAAKTSELNDYSVCTTWGVERENYYLIDVFRRRLNYPDLKRAIVSHAEVFDADKIVIEGKSSGTQLIQDLQNDGVWKVVEYKPPPGADKVMRLHACSDRFESGRVVLPRNAPWLLARATAFVAAIGDRRNSRRTDQPPETGPGQMLVHGRLLG